ncbi:hypothetical protein [Lactococcus petauri]|uniref:hypothetical protein n=1 Tax=Lactococcus petauri TaxID=1940789 RepID=UPI0018AB43F9|nr:hypothetical protein [Lactococcus petauri]MDC0826083.1 hypothetical protein [Lactococcus petauri]
MKKYKVQCKTIEIKTDFTHPSWQANILIDGESLFENGRGITNIIYEGKSPDLPQLFIEGNSELMTEFIKDKLVNL